MNKCYKLVQLIVGGLLIIIALLDLFFEDLNFYSLRYPYQTWIILISLGLIAIFYSRLIEFSFLSLNLKIKESKHELHLEGEKILLNLYIHSIILNSNDKNKTHQFFYAHKVGTEIDISQSNNYFLNELAARGYIEYLSKGIKTNNAINDQKEVFNVKIIKIMPI